MATNFNASSKFLGYDILSPGLASASVTKFEGYSVLSPGLDSASVSKCLGYVITSAKFIKTRVFCY